MRECLYRMLNISKTSHYSSALRELNLIPINNIIDQLKIGFVNSLVNNKGSGVCLDTILEEELKYPGTGMIAEVKNLCKIYGILDVTQYNVDKSIIKQKVWAKARDEIWINSMRNRRVPFSPTVGKSKKQYWTFPKHQAKLLLSHYIGELSFKDNKRYEMIKKFGSTKCFYGCDAPDSMKHVMECENYNTQLKDYPQDGTDRKFAPYLVALDVERWRNFQCPLIYRLDKAQRKQRNNVNK